MQKIKYILIVNILILSASVALLLSLVQFSYGQDVWYTCYEKGLELMEQAEWEEAINNFQKAIKLEEKPAKKKRTYGMRFISYYPYLNIGTSYYNMEKFKDAISYLEKSRKYGVAPKKEIEKYLTMCRKEKAKTTVQPPPPPQEKVKKEDVIPPTIILTKPEDDTVEAETDSLYIQGRIEDNEHVDKCEVLHNGKALAKGEVNVVRESSRVTNFSCTVNRLQPGNNKVKVVAWDRKGNKNEKQVVVLYTTDPPEAVNHLDLGKKHYQQARYEKAQKELRLSQTLLVTAEKKCEAFLYLGFIQLAFGEEAHAKANFIQALKLVPDKVLDPEIYAPKVIKMFNECK